MASQDQRLISVIKNSTSRRRNRPETRLDAQEDIRSSTRPSRNGYRSSLETTSEVPPPSGTGMDQKLARLSQLEIPAIPQSAQLFRYPTILRAGTATTMNLPRDPIQGDRQKVFMASRYSFLPKTMALPNLMRDMPYLSPDQAISPFTLVPSAAAKEKSHSREAKSDNNKTDTGTELRNLRTAINTLYDSSCLIIPPYLLDRLNQLGVVDNKHEFAFQNYRSDELTITMEKLDRIQQFLPVLKRVIDLVSASLVKGRASSARGA